MAVKKSRTLTLAEYVEELGVEAFADKYDVTERAAKNYLYGLRRPRPQSRLVQDLLEKSPLTWAGIYAAESQSA